jgi:hypothetical protein
MFFTLTAFTFDADISKDALVVVVNEVSEFK